MGQCIILLLLAYIFNLIDCWQTLCAVEAFGLRVEANPIARWLFEHDCAVEVKIILPAMLFTLIGIIVKFEKRHIWAAWFITILYFIVVINNFITLSKLGLL